MINFQIDEIISACPFSLTDVRCRKYGADLIIEWYFNFDGLSYRYGRTFSTKEFDNVADQQAFKSYQLEICRRDMVAISGHQPQ